jgi:hypothetical protein
MGEFIDEGTFDRAEFSKELEAAPDNTDVGTRVWFENDRIRVWEIRLAPGERAPFHHHTRRYFWTAVEDSVGKQRTPDGTYRVREYRVGDTMYLEQSPDEQMIHDLENIGDTEMRFVTVELLD